MQFGHLKRSQKLNNKTELSIPECNCRLLSDWTENTDFNLTGAMSYLIRFWWRHKGVWTNWLFWSINSATISWHGCVVILGYLESRSNGRRHIWWYRETCSSWYLQYFKYTFQYCTTITDLLTWILHLFVRILLMLSLTG